MKIPDVDLEELKNFKKKNVQERLEFIDNYAEWVKKQEDKDWSSEQNKLID